MFYNVQPSKKNSAICQKYGLLLLSQLYENLRFEGGGGGGGSLLPEETRLELPLLVLQANRLMQSFSGSPMLIYSGPMVTGLGGLLLLTKSWLSYCMLDEYIVAHPESFECIVDVAELCLEFPSELLLLLLLAVSNIPAQICQMDTKFKLLKQT